MDLEVRVLPHYLVDKLVLLRRELWPRHSLAEHRRLIERYLNERSRDWVIFVAVDVHDSLTGFIEGSIRHEYVNGCRTSPVAFLEGVYVQRKYRHLGIGRLLLAALERWGQERDCSELAADVLLGNINSQSFHVSVGFVETERVVFFRKSISKEAPC